jgi:hypothetical protein
MRRNLPGERQETRNSSGVTSVHFRYISAHSGGGGDSDRNAYMPLTGGKLGKGGNAGKAGKAENAGKAGKADGNC